MVGGWEAAGVACASMTPSSFSPSPGTLALAVDLGLVALGGAVGRVVVVVRYLVGGVSCGWRFHTGSIDHCIM